MDSLLSAVQAFLNADASAQVLLVGLGALTVAGLGLAIAFRVVRQSRR